MANQKKNEALLKWEKGEEAARHGLFVFLLFLTLSNLDVMSQKTMQEKELATKTWVSWGVIFILLAFFIITPEQELLQSLAAKK